MTRNYGLRPGVPPPPEPTTVIKGGYPRLCICHEHHVVCDCEPDWPKPPGCRCNKLAQAHGCENRCDDSMYEDDRVSNSFGHTWLLIVVVIAVTAFALMSRGHTAEIPTCDIVERQMRPLVRIMVRENREIAPMIVAAKRCIKRSHRN